MVHYDLTLRRRATNSARDPLVSEKQMKADAPHVAAIVCDMWNAHWCAGASRRVEELAPIMNRLIHSLRNSGSLIIHAPSDTMEFYEGVPARLRAQRAPYHEPPCNVTDWRRLDSNIEGELPIDDSAGGCDDLPPCPIPDSMPWTRQHSGIVIADVDAITDKGQEVYNLLEEYRIELVLMMGVHTNMCVLGRPFGIRRLAESGRSVALVRDMTDAMYCSRCSPYVDHTGGTELVIEHIERYWCPTITSNQVLGGEPFRFRSH